jgi:hypothetical protein
MNYPRFIGYNLAPAQFIRADAVLAVLFLSAPGVLMQRRRDRCPALCDRFVSDDDRVFLTFGSAYQHPTFRTLILKHDPAPLILEKNRIRRRTYESLWRRSAMSVPDGSGACNLPKKQICRVNGFTAE